MNEDRRIISGNLPAEFAERVSDPIDFADQLAWERARRQFQTRRRSTMPEFQHITIDTVRHFLVVDSMRGPVAYGPDEPAMHPRGFLYYPKNGSRTPPSMRGKLLAIIEAEVNDVVEPLAPEVEAAHRSWNDAVRVATDRHLNAWPEAK